MPDSEKLTKREEEIARAYAEGLTHKEIAARLCVAPATVRTHLNNIYRKLDVRTKVELLRRIGTVEATPDLSRLDRRRRWSGHLGLTVVALLGGLALLALITIDRSDRMLPEPIRPRVAGLPSVVVLPASGSLAEGAARSDVAAWLARQIVTGLSLFATVRVFVPDSTVADAAQALAPGEVAARLGATYILSVDARWFGDVILVDVQLQHAATAEVLWATTIERREEELYVIRSEVVEEVVALFGPNEG